MVPTSRSYGPVAPNARPANTGVRDFTSIRTTSALTGAATSRTATSVRRIIGTSKRQYTRGVCGGNDVLFPITAVVIVERLVHRATPGGRRSPAGAGAAARSGKSPRRASGATLVHRLARGANGVSPPSGDCS